MQLGYHDGPLAGSGGDPLGRAMAHVANGKDAGQAGLMDQGCASEWRSSDRASLVHQVDAGKQVAAIVALDLRGQPIRERLRCL
jgi:hypothetical protein